jgi:HK97 family phage major capsid protein
MSTLAQQIKALNEERAAKLKELDGLVDTMTKEARAFNADEQKKYDGFKAEVESINQRLAVLVDKQKRDAETATPMFNTGASAGDISRSEEKDIAKFSFLKVARNAANRKPLDGLEAEMNKEAEREMREAGASPTGSGYAIPLVVLRHSMVPVQKRDMTATGGTNTEGGFNVATEKKGYIEALVEESRVISLGADYIPGAVGNISMPRENAVYTAGWKNGENATTAEKNPTYTEVTLTPKRLGGYIDVSNQLLAQTAPGFEARIRRQIMNGQANGIDAGAINGAGNTGEPTGILQTSNIGSVVGGTDGAAPDRDDLVDLWKAVGVAKGLRGSLHFLSNPQVFAKLAKTKTDSGSGIFVLDQMKSFMGYNFAVSTNVPSTLDKGTSTGVCSAIIFGNFNDLMITQWGGVEILVDPYTQALTGLTRMVVNTFTDLAVLRPASFAAMKDATT